MFNIVHILKKTNKLFVFKEKIFLFFIILFYFLTRTIKLDNLPIFSDEAIYIHWAKVAWHDASWRFISLTDGKQPLQTWGTIPFLKLFPYDLLTGGRLFSVATGFFGLLGMITLLHYLFGKKTALIGAILYVVTPYFVFYDRMALVDSGVNAFFIWILFFSIVLIRTVRLDVALMFGILSGVALLAKSSVRIFIGLSALAPLLIISRKDKQTWTKTLNFFTLMGIVGIMSLVLYNVQRLSPFFHYVAEKNKTFIVTPEEFLHHPFALFVGNLKAVSLYTFWESGFLLPLCAIGGLILLYKKDKRMAIYLFCWFFLSFIIICSVSKVIFPRYLIFFAAIYTILAAYFIAHIGKYTSILLGIIIIISVFFSYPMIFDYTRISLPPIDRGQYVEGGTVGLGAREILQYARERSKEKPVIIITEGFFGMAGDVLDIFTQPNDKIFIKSYWPFDHTSYEENKKELQDHFVFVVLPYQSEYPQDGSVRLIRRYEKPGGKTAITFLEMIR
ncbi:MAG: glycosyltransferase family 39 protein [bacterium]|nr:glycosyltransferase family 39 protein [bacterium]